MFQGFFMSGAPRPSFLCAAGTRNGQAVRKRAGTAHMVVTGGQPGQTTRKDPP